MMRTLQDRELQGSRKRVAFSDTLPDRPSRFRISLPKLIQRQPSLARGIFVGCIDCGVPGVLFVEKCEETAYLLATLFDEQCIHILMRWRVCRLGDFDLNELSISSCEISGVSALCFWRESECWVSVISLLNGPRAVSFQHHAPQQPLLQMHRESNNIILDVCVSALFVYRVSNIKNEGLTIRPERGVELEALAGKVRIAMDRSLVLLDFTTQMLPRQSDQSWPLRVRMTLRLRTLDRVVRLVYAEAEIGKKSGSERLLRSRVVNRDLAIRASMDVRTVGSFLTRQTAGQSLQRRDFPRILFRAHQQTQTVLSHPSTPYFISCK